MPRRMILLDASIRFSAVTLLLLMAVLTLRDARHLLQGRLAAACCICLSGMFLSTMPSWYDAPLVVKVVSWIFHVPNVVLLWLFGLSLFQDDFRLQRWHWGVLATSIICVFSLQTSIYLEYQPVTYLAMIGNRLIGFGVLAHLIWTALSGRKDDLIETRRRTRLWFVIGMGLSALVIISGETLHYGLTGNNSDPDWLTTIRVIVAWPVIVFGTLWFLRLLPETLLFDPVEKPLPAKPKVDPKDAATHTRLTAAMENEHLFREQGLSIGMLAQKLNVPEHQLRALINKGLGYRNFAAFLNQYRLGDAKQALSDPAQARIPILTIAMDSGYASLATFNRAFKAEVGQTPSDFRTKALEKAVQS
ncbi:MAG: helix-turn-helix domain-containing protein [Henriciella sp.]|nr:helix-turn-helix domain-containing protein [Henriciella sp.]